MAFFADFHIHSKYSRATSPRMDLPGIAQAAKVKGIKVVGTGDFTHPQWLSEIKENLKPAEPGLFVLRDRAGTAPKGAGLSKAVRFILTSEISCIYSQGGRVRKVHILLFAPSIEAVEKINSQLAKIGNLKADGRPILGLSAKELAKIALNTCPECLVAPGHIWTPWFSLFGSKSGFDSIEECFGEFSKHIFAVETGLSSDPAMNWRLSALDNICLISCSDAHSPAKLGRELCQFETDFSYHYLIKAIKDKNPKTFLSTIEFFPEEGKYHYDGHRLCNISTNPQETKKYNGLCPRCGRPLVVGVLSRVDALADRPEGFQPKGAIPFQSLIPLEEIIAEVLNVGVQSKRVAQAYQHLIEKAGSELNVLLKLPVESLKSIGPPGIDQAVRRVRQGKVQIKAGYDGLYGKITIFSKKEKERLVSQPALF